MTRKPHIYNACLLLDNQFSDGVQLHKFGEENYTATYSGI